MKGRRASCSRPLFFEEALAGWWRDDSAGDAYAGVAAWVCLHIVFAGMDDDGRAAVGEDGVCSGEVERDGLDYEGLLSRAIGGNLEVERYIPVVESVWIMDAVFFAGRVKVRPRRSEVGGNALRILMDMDGVFARRKVHEVELKGNGTLFVREGDGTRVLAFGCCDLDLHGLTGPAQYAAG